jgi:hypothetical protein
MATAVIAAASAVQDVGTPGAAHTAGITATAVPVARRGARAGIRTGIVAARVGRRVSAGHRVRPSLVRVVVRPSPRPSPRIAVLAVLDVAPAARRPVVVLAVVRTLARAIRAVHRLAAMSSSGWTSS